PARRPVIRPRDFTGAPARGAPRRRSALRLPRHGRGFCQCIAPSRNKRSAPRDHRRPRLRKTFPMNIESIRALSGSNLWSDQPVLEAVVVHDQKGFTPETLNRLCASLPAELSAALRRDFVAAEPAASWA